MSVITLHIKSVCELEYFTNFIELFDLVPNVSISRDESKSNGGFVITLNECAVKYDNVVGVLLDSLRNINIGLRFLKNWEHISFEARSDIMDNLLQAVDMVSYIETNTNNANIDSSSITSYEASKSHNNNNDCIGEQEMVAIKDEIQAATNIAVANDYAQSDIEHVNIPEPTHIKVATVVDTVANADEYLQYKDTDTDRMVYDKAIHNARVTTKKILRQAENIDN